MTVNHGQAQATKLIQRACCAAQKSIDYLKDDGLYICEDLQTSYWPRCGGSRINLNKKNTSLSFFKTLVDSGNYESYDRPFYKKSKFDGNIK